MFDSATQSLLDRYRFDAARLERQQALLRQSPYSADAARVTGTLVPLPRDQYVDVDDRHRALGEEAIRKGEVAFLLLNGGMATRFGGVAKGAAKALGEQSFLELRMRQARGVPCVLMCSFATEEATHKHLAEKDYFGFDEDDVHVCVQGISVRLTETGDIFKDGDAPSLYAPGHGDLPWTLHVNGVAEKLKKRGVKTIFVSNVDNLGCSLDPAVLGAHLAANKPLSVETVDPDPVDVGGAPFLLDGKLQLLEGFRLPKDYSASKLTGFNVNSFYFDWPALDPDVQLGFYAVAKKVGDKKAIQFERIVGEVTRHVPSTFLRVPRDLEKGRFLPVKAPEDLMALQPVLRKRYPSRVTKA